MSRVGFEPTTHGLKVRCSTAELPAHVCVKWGNCLPPGDSLVADMLLQRLAAQRQASSCAASRSCASVTRLDLLLETIGEL